MFSPQMMEAAQKMMSNMKPEDMAKMSQMAANMDPKAMENMMKNAPGGGLPPGMDHKQAMDQMKNMSPEEMQRNMQAAQAQMGAQKTYYMNAAETLKKEGNDLIKSEKFSEALEKYNRGIENLKGHSGSDVTTMLVNLYNNSALCHLKKKQYKDALTAAEEALKVDSKSYKALFRRGQAKDGLGDLQEAVSDVRRAHEISPNDKTIDAELTKLRLVLKERGIKESFESPTTAPAAMNPSSSAGSSSSAKGAGSNMDFAKMSEKMNDPDMLKSATEMMSKMSPEDMENMMKMSGQSLPSGVDAATMKSQVEMLQKNPDMMKMAMDQMKNMPDEERQRLMQRAGAGRGTGAGDAPNPAAVLENPEMLKQAAEMAKNMSAEDMQRLNIGSPEEADMMRQAAEQMASNPDMMKQMSDMMKNMPPEQLEAMMKMRGSMGGGGAGASSGAGVDPSAMMSDPDMMKTAEAMMSSMSPEMLASMAKASGVDLSEDKAKMVAKFLPFMLRLMRWFGHLKKGWKVMWSPKGRIVIAVFVVLIAVYQHYRS